MKYKVSYRGFAYVEAENPEEAEEKKNEGDEIYSESWTESIEEVDDFIVCLEE